MTHSGARVVEGEDALAPHGTGRGEAHLRRGVPALFAQRENSGAVRRPSVGSLDIGLIRRPLSYGESCDDEQRTR
jgi:hypothetical protein